jgi:hypothetical protein
MIAAIVGILFMLCASLYLAGRIFCLFILEPLIGLLVQFSAVAFQAFKRQKARLPCFDFGSS